MRYRKTFHIVGAATVFLGSQTISAVAAGQSFCAERTEVISELAQINAETPTAIGISENGILIELLVSPSGDWTLLGTSPSRKSCVIAIGKHWESIPIAATAPDA